MTRPMDAATTDEAADVVIIGAGASGAVAAKRLSEAGMRVVCLEQGDWPDYSKARAMYDDFEVSAGSLWNYNPNTRRAPSDYPIDDSESDISAVLWNGVGGSTVQWAANWMRNLPSDFRVRSLDGVADDWPLSYADLEPYYREVERDFAVSGLGGDPAYPGTFTPPLRPMALHRAGELVARGHNRLGWHWWPGCNAIATEPHGALSPCVQRATCMWGCVDRAKASTDLTHWPMLIKRGVQLVTGARVSRIPVDARGLAIGAEYIDRDGRQHLQRASVTILAANGIGTPRILLASGPGGRPEGLANSSGLVGRRLMMHPVAGVVGLFDEDLKTYVGPFGQIAYCLQFYETDESRGFVRGAKWSLQPTGGPLQAIREWPWGQAELWGDRFHAAIATRFSHSVSWGIICEDLPDADNRVVLDPTLTDPDGISAPKLVYKTSENSRRLLAFHVARAQESLEAAGAQATVVAPQIRETGWHVSGTAKMGEDPSTSVVDPWGRCHDVDNLYIVDGSIWPTSSGVNPLATITALALRCAGHLVSTRQEQRTP